MSLHGRGDTVAAHERHRRFAASGFDRERVAVHLINRAAHPRRRCVFRKPGGCAEHKGCQCSPDPNDFVFLEIMLCSFGLISRADKTLPMTASSNPKWRSYGHFQVNSTALQLGRLKRDGDLEESAPGLGRRRGSSESNVQPSIHIAAST